MFRSSDRIDEASVSGMSHRDPLPGDHVRLEGVLETIVERGRKLVEARTLLVLLDDGGRLFIAAASGRLDAEAKGIHLPTDGAAWRGPMVDRRLTLGDLD